MRMAPPHGPRTPSTGPPLRGRSGCGSSSSLTRSPSAACSSPRASSAEDARSGCSQASQRWESRSRREWTGLIREGLVFGRSPRASTFYVITGFHGFHVLAGVLYITTVLLQYLRGRATAHHVELLGLYWCFVDFVWIFVFSFVYLMP